MCKAGYRLFASERAVGPEDFFARRDCTPAKCLEHLDRWLFNQLIFTVVMGQLMHLLAWATPAEQPSSPIRAGI